MEFDPADYNVACEFFARLFYGGNAWRIEFKGLAGFLIFDSRAWLRKEFKRAAQKEAKNNPQAREFAAGNVLQPPSEAATLEAFSRVELK